MPRWRSATGLVAYIALTIMSLLTLIHLNVEELWEHYYPQSVPHEPPERWQVLPELPPYRYAR